MHQTRAQVSKKIPLPRKGSKYVARSLMDLKNSIPVVIAVRDMLQLARTAKEVKKMIIKKSLRINGKEVKDYRDSIRLFNLLDADKSYILTFNLQGKFVLEETKQKDRPCKVIGKKLLPGKKIQLNLHDGTNVLTNNSKIRTNDTVYLDESQKIKEHLELGPGKDCMIIKGKFLGRKARINKILNDKVSVNIQELNFETTLDKEGVIII